ncbi:MAG: LacI family transcriptional regulator [Planctomycetota bacterium]|jgi:LacI family transcriptional regulator
MLQRKSVALLIETSHEYARDLLRGVSNYAKQAHAWSIYMGEGQRGGPPPSWLEGWDGHGIIARVESQAMADAIAATGLPVVDVSAARLLPEIPWVETDDEEIAILAAEHLLERGFRHFGFCGDTHYKWGRWRCEAFIRHLSQRGFKVSIFDPPINSPFPSEPAVEALEGWIRSLPKPIGVMTSHDLMGRQVLDSCRRIDIAVPESVAVVSVDNDSVLCALSDPPMTSIVPDGMRAGFRAAEILDAMMGGEHQSREANLIKPIGLVTRQSTDVSAIEDAEVAKALNCIRRRACEGIKVQDVLDVVSISRRSLEARFRNALGRTPHQEIQRVRMRRVRELLKGTDLTIAAIAQRAGYHHVEYLTVAFRREVGMPPSVWRKQAQA